MSQDYALEVSTAPGSEPITTAQARLHLRLTTTLSGSPPVASHPDDTLVDNLTKAAREIVEGHTGRAIITQTLKMYLDHWPWDGVIRLPRSPAKTVTSIQYVDTAGDTQTWDSSEYRTDFKSEPARVTLEDGESFPDLLNVTNNVIVTFTAGYSASPTLVPEHLISAMMLMLAHLYEHREAVEDAVGGVTLIEMPLAYKNLIGLDPVWDF